MRLLIVLLLLANGAYYFWAQGQFSSLGLAPVNPSEPQHLSQQVNEQALKVLSSDESRRLAAAAAAAAAATECLQAGPLDDKQAAAVRSAATEALSAGQWALDPVTVPGRWIVYMGRYADADTLNHKKAELRARRISFEPLQNPALEPGLSLGGFGSQAEANAALAALAQRGVRTARVVQERADGKAFTFKLPAVDEVLRARLDAVRSSLGGKALHSC